MDEIVDNHIEERLNDLLEETRRKMFKYENNFGTREDLSESPSDDDMRGGVNGMEFGSNMLLAE